MRISLLGFFALVILQMMGLPVAFLIAWVVAQMYFGILEQRWFIFMFSLIAGLIIDLVTVVQLGLTAMLLIVSIIFFWLLIHSFDKQSLIGVSLLAGALLVLRQSLVGPSVDVLVVALAMLTTPVCYWIRLRLEESPSIKVNRQVFK